MTDFIRQRQTQRYRDFDFNFTAHPVSGDLSMLSHENSIKQSLKNLVRLNFFEFPFEPSLGSGVPGVLFNNINSTTEADISEKIQTVIKSYEPRVEIISVDTSSVPDENRVDCRVEYYMINDPRPMTVDFVLNRNR